MRDVDRRKIEEQIERLGIMDLHYFHGFIRKEIIIKQQQEEQK